MFQRLTAIIIGLVLTTFVNCVTASQGISDAQARRLTPAVAKVMLQRDTTIALLHYCGGRFNSLKTAGEHARHLWLQRNQAILNKADSLQQRLWQSLKQRQSGLKADTLNLNITHLLQQNVQNKVHALASYPPIQQHALCNHLILSIRAGDWDISHKQAKAFSTLENFH